MSKLTRDNMAWVIAVTLVAIAINPVLKSLGLLPADVFKSLGVFFPGLPQIVFGPLIGFLLVLCFLKTAEASIFPIVGILRAVSLSFVFPANIEHGGTAIAGILAGFVAMSMVKDVAPEHMRSRMAVLGGLFAGFYAAGNYCTTLLFGPAAQTQVILASPEIAIGIVLGAVAIGAVLGAVAYDLMRRLPARAMLLQPRLA